MEEENHGVEGSPIGSRQANMKKFFNLAIRSVLGACSKQDICKAFPSFISAEQDHLYRLWIQVVTSLHSSMEDDFKTVCLETQVGTALDFVEQLVEEQALDLLHSDKTNVMDVAQNVLTTKKNEVEHLKNMLQMAEKQNQHLQTRLDALEKGASDPSTLTDTVEMVRRETLSYALHNSHMINHP